MNDKWVDRAFVIFILWMMVLATVMTLLLAVITAGMLGWRP